MRILLFTQQFASSRTGVGTDALVLASGLFDRGHEVCVAGPAGESADVRGIRYISVSPCRLDATPGRWISLGQSFSHVLHSRFKEYDIAHFTDAREAWKIHPRLIPVVGKINDAYAADWFQPAFPRHMYSDRAMRTVYYYFLRKIEHRVYPRLSGIIATSRYVAGIVRAAYGIDPARIHVVYSGIPDHPEPVPVPLEGRPAVIFTGANFQRKGLPVLFHAASLLKVRFPDIRIHVVGKDRNQKALAKKARDLGIHENVLFHGWRPNPYVRAMMAGADVLALPSFTEGFGIVCLEAMQVGTPVVATSRGGLAEVFSGSEAIFVRPGDPAGLANAIDRIVSDRSTALQLRNGGRQAAARFNIHATAEAAEAVFLEILKHHQVR